MAGFARGGAATTARLRLPSEPAVSTPTADPSLPVRRVRVHPTGLSGQVRVPGDKSLSHRALLLGALVGETVPVAGLAPSGDVAATAEALRGLGARVDLHPDAEGQLQGEVRGPLREASDVLDCGNSGTSLRLLCGVVAGIEGLHVLSGDASLRRRPVQRVAVPLREMGARVDARGGGSLPPVVVHGGELRGIVYRSPVASAQVKSCVLLAGLRAQGPTTVISPLPSRDHTERLLAHLGHPVRAGVGEDGHEVVTIEPGTLRPAPIAVAGDPSSAAFWLVAAAAGAGEVEVRGVCANPTRLGVVQALRQLGAEVGSTLTGQQAGEPVATLSAAPASLAGAVLGGRLVVDAIDELPVLAVAGAMSRHGLEVGDAAELRVKESDRIAVLASALGAVGIHVEQRADGYRVAGQQRPRGGTVDAHGDHRIAMTAAIAGVLGTAAVEITGFEAVATSYPAFLADLQRLGGRVEVLDAG